MNPVLFEQAKKMYRIAEIPEDQRSHDQQEQYNQGIKAKQLIVEQNMGLVGDIVWKLPIYGWQSITHDDLINVGVLAIEKKLKDYDPSKGKFSTFIMPWIRGEVLKALHQHISPIRPSRKIQSRANKIQKISAQLKKKGINPTVSVLAKELKLSPKAIREALDLTKLPVSLNQIIATGENDTTEFIESLDSTIFPQFNYDEDTARSRWVQKALDDLPLYESVVIEYLWGIRGTDQGDSSYLSKAKRMKRLALAWSIPLKKVEKYAEQGMSRLRQQMSDSEKPD